jgi:hypothetical protein
MWTPSSPQQRGLKNHRPKPMLGSGRDQADDPFTTVSGWCFGDVAKTDDAAAKLREAERSVYDFDRAAVGCSSGHERKG